MKRALAILTTLLMSLSLLAACDGEDAAAEPKRIDTLRLMFTPSSGEQTILDTTGEFREALKTELLDRGYDVGTVEITVGGSYEAVGSALAAGTADVGVGMPGGAYVKYDDACEVILTATRSGLSKDYDDPKDWNDEMPTVLVDNRVVYYRSLIIAGPTDTGRALAARVNAGQELSWEELDAAAWGVMDKTSSAGYIYPALWLQERFGKSISDLSRVVTSGNYEDAFARLAAGEIDVLAAYADARTEYAQKWNAEFGREESIWGDTNVIGVTDGIYNDAIAVSKTSAIMDEGLTAALQDAFIHIAETSVGKEVIDVYGHRGYQRAASADYDSERAAQQLLAG